MPTVDWIFLGLLLGSVLLGAWRGLVYEVLSMLNWVGAFVLAQCWAPSMAMYLPVADLGESLRYVAGFVLVFVASLFAGSLLVYLVKKVIAAVGLAPIDRVLGACFGSVRGLVLVLSATVVVGMTPLHTGPWWSEARGPRMAAIVLKGLKPVLPQEFGKYLPE